MALFFHVDMDAFFAAVEQHDNPAWANRAVIVGAIPGRRGVVAACSYQARAFGVHSGQNTAKAYELCPEGLYVMPNMARYHEVSQKMMAVLSGFCDDLEPLSFDEAWLNLSNHAQAHHDPVFYAQQIKKTIKEKIGLTISVGIGSNRLLAKLASAHQKPDGLFWLTDDECSSFIKSLPLKKLWGVGKKSREELARLNITTVEALQQCSLDFLQQQFGPKFSVMLYNSCRGIDVNNHDGKVKNRSIGNETTLEEDSRDEEYLLQQLLILSHRSFARMRANNVESNTLAIKIRFKNFDTVQIQKTLGSAIISAEQLYHEVKKLFYIKWTKHAWVRLLGVTLCNVSSYRQLTLFSEQDEKRRKIDRLMDDFKRQGFLITKASLLQQEKARRAQAAKGRLIFDGKQQKLMT